MPFPTEEELAIYGYECACDFYEGMYDPDNADEWGNFCEAHRNGCVRMDAALKLIEKGGLAPRVEQLVLFWIHRVESTRASDALAKKPQGNKLADEEVSKGEVERFGKLQGRARKSL